MDTLNRGQILDLIQSKQGISNPLLALAPFAFIDDGEKPDEMITQEAPKQFGVGLDVIASADRMRRVVTAGGGEPGRTAVLYRTLAGQAVGVLVDEAERWSFLREAELKQAVLVAIPEAFGKQPSGALKTSAVSRFSMAEAGTLAALIDLHYARRSAGEGQDSAFSLAEIRGLVGKPGGLLSTVVLSLALTNQETDDEIEKSLAALEAGGWVVKKGDGWLPAEKSAAFSVASAGGNEITSLTTVNLAEGFTESAEAVLILDGAGTKALLISEVEDGRLEWKRYGAFSARSFFDEFFGGPEPGQPPAEKEQPAVQPAAPPRQARKKSFASVVGLIISLLSMLCSCGMLAYGLIK